MLKEKNQKIVEAVRKTLRELGLDMKLDIEPIESLFKSRPLYGVYKDGKMKFAVKLWELNKLDDQELSDEIDARIAKARAHFSI